MSRILRPVPSAPLPPPVTDRERQVILCIAQRFRDDRIAAELKMNRLTVQAHIQSAMRKLDYTNKLGLIFWAIKEGHVTIPGVANA